MQKLPPHLRGDPDGVEPSGVIELALPNFFKLLKQQRDIESPQIGYCQGFYFRLLVHPRGTDAESSHLSVFLEALKQPWFPDDWVFPNVRFDLTVVNWRDPKDNVNSWAHWTFCDDTTSRGWQRMLPQSKISRARGFLNDEDTLLVRGKAEPVFWGPWSRKTLTFLPKNLWDLLPTSVIPQGDETPVTPTRKASTTAEQSSKRLHSRRTGSLVHRSPASGEVWECMVPTLVPTLHSDYLSCMLHILFHLKPLRKLICGWRSKAGKSSVIEALQQTFFQMQLWPTIMCSIGEDQSRQESPSRCRSVHELLGKYNDAITMPPGGGPWNKFLHHQTSCKAIFKALGLHCVQRMTFADPFAELHQRLFTAIHNECRLDFLSDLVVTADTNRTTPFQAVQLDGLLDALMGTSPRPAESSDHHPEDLCAREQLLLSDGGYANGFIKIRHVQSVQKALEATGRTFETHPSLLFIYVSPQKTIRKGELFDVPIRTDLSFMAASSQAPVDGRWYSLFALVIKDGDSHSGVVNSYSSSLSTANGFYLLIRPDEESPWYRICNGRVEKLLSKVPFTEWKCHREFFCAAAVYLAEDFIDAQVQGSPTDLRQLNPGLYSETLSHFGLPESFLDKLWHSSTREASPRLRCKGDVCSDEDSPSLFSPFSGFFHDNKLTPAPRITDFDHSSSSKPVSALVDSAHSGFLDRCRGLLTDAITRKDAISVHALLLEVFGRSDQVDDKDFHWALGEASRRAIRVASAVDQYLQAGFTPERTHQERGRNFVKPLTSDAQLDHNNPFSASQDESITDSLEAPGELETPAELENWVTRQVSIVWDLLAGVDRNQTLQPAGKAPFADVFCLAILESVEFRVLKTALASPQHQDEPSSIWRPNSSLRRRHGDTVIHHEEEDSAPSAFSAEQAKRVCTPKSGTDMRFAFSKSRESLPQDSFQAKKRARDSDFINPMPLIDAEMSKQLFAFRKLLQCTRPSGSKVLSICYGQVVAKRRVRAATRRDLLRLQRQVKPRKPFSSDHLQLSTDTTSIGPRYSPTPQTHTSLFRIPTDRDLVRHIHVAGDTNLLDVTSSCTGLLLSQGKRRRSEGPPIPSHRSEPVTVPPPPSEPPLLLSASSLFSQVEAAQFNSKAFPPPRIVGPGKRLRVTVWVEASPADEDPTRGPGGVHTGARSERCLIYVNGESNAKCLYQYFASSIRKRLLKWRENPSAYNALNLIPTLAISAAAAQLGSSGRTATGRSPVNTLSQTLSQSWNDTIESSFVLFLYSMSASVSSSGQYNTLDGGASSSRWTFLNPSERLDDIAHYTSPEEDSRHLSNPFGDLQILIVLACSNSVIPSKLPVRSNASKGSRNAKRKVSKKDLDQGAAEGSCTTPLAVGTDPSGIAHAESICEDTARPLLVFKWFDRDQVALISLGAVVCESKLALQEVIATWVLLRALTTAPRLLEPIWAAFAQAGVPAKDLLSIQPWSNPALWLDKIALFQSMLLKIDTSALFVVAEELYAPGNAQAREFQNIRRVNASIRKLNKKTGEVVIVQWSSEIETASNIPSRIFSAFNECGVSKFAQIIGSSASSQSLVAKIAAEIKDAKNANVLGCQTSIPPTKEAVDAFVYEVFTAARECRRALVSDQDIEADPEDDFPIPQILADDPSVARGLTKRKKKFKATRWAHGRQTRGGGGNAHVKNRHQNNNSPHLPNVKSGSERTLSPAAAENDSGNDEDEQLNQENRLLEAELDPAAFIGSERLSVSSTSPVAGDNGHEDVALLLEFLTPPQRYARSQAILPTLFSLPTNGGGFTSEFRELISRCNEVDAREGLFLSSLKGKVGPLVAAEYRADTWSGLIWLQQIELLMVQPNMNLDQTSCSEYANALIGLLRDDLFNLALPSEMNSGEESSIVQNRHRKRKASIENGALAIAKETNTSAVYSPTQASMLEIDSIEMEDLVPEHGSFQDELEFFHEILKNPSIIATSQLIAGCLAALSQRRALHTLCLEALDFFQTEPSFDSPSGDDASPSGASPMAVFERGYELYPKQYRGRYTIALAICYALLLSLPSFPAAGQANRKFFQSLTKRLEKCAGFTLAALGPRSTECDRFRQLNRLLLQAICLVSRVVADHDHLATEWPGSQVTCRLGESFHYDFKNSLFVDRQSKLLARRLDEIIASGDEEDASQGPMRRQVSEEPSTTIFGNDTVLPRPHGWRRCHSACFNAAVLDSELLRDSSSRKLPSAEDEISDDFSVDEDVVDDEESFYQLSHPRRPERRLSVDDARAAGPDVKVGRLRNSANHRSSEKTEYLRRKTGRSLVHKDEPRVVRESKSWFVVSKPAFWHCSGPGQSTEHPIDLNMLRAGYIEEATASISLPKLQRSGKMESFHLWMMKKYPELETVKKWTELECGLCHRIDLETSGALLIAKTHRSRDLIWEQFRRRYVHKEYLLLCHGRISDLHGTVKTRLLTKDYGTNKSRRIKSHFTTVVAEGGEVALTEYHVCKVFRRKEWHDIQSALRERPQRVGENVLGESRAGQTYPLHKKTKDEQTLAGMCLETGVGGADISAEEFSLCKCRIITGRTHQIRVHMRHIGHPLVSDTKYLDSDRCQEDRQWCPRMFLHAAALEFADPDAQPGTFTEAICPLAHELVQAMEAALVCVEDFVNLESYGVRLGVDEVSVNAGVSVAY